MIFRLNQLTGIKNGSISLAFRRWNKLNMPKGSTMKTALGVWCGWWMTCVKPITKTDAIKGLHCCRPVDGRTHKVGSGEIYKVKVRYESEDPRLELREKTDSGVAAHGKLVAKLERLDKTRTVVLESNEAHQTVPRTTRGRPRRHHANGQTRFQNQCAKAKVNLGLTVNEIKYVRRHWARW